MKLLLRTYTGLVFALVSPLIPRGLSSAPAMAVPNTPPAISPSALPLSNVSVRFPIPIVESGQASFYLAEDQGYYAREGLRVHWEMGSPDLNPVKMVVSGADTFGVIGGLDTLLVARSKGYPVKAVAVIHRNSNFPCLVTLKSSGITRVEQLDKKKVGFFYGHISTDCVSACNFDPQTGVIGVQN